MFKQKNQPSSVLIVDDDKAFAERLALQLSKILNVLTVEVADNLEQTKTLLADPEREFDLVIIEQELPDGYGDDFIRAGYLRASAILSVTASDINEAKTKAIGAGATFCIHKSEIEHESFEPLILGLIQRNQIARKLLKAETDLARTDAINTLVKTLQHEINNPLTVILGSSELIKHSHNLAEDFKLANNLSNIEQASLRIQSVMEKFVQVDLPQSTMKSRDRFSIVPGDDPWD